MQYHGQNISFDDMESAVKAATKELFHSTALGKDIFFENGSYRYFPLKPIKALQSSLSVDREILTLLVTYEDIQARTISVLKHVQHSNPDRFDKSVLIVIHNDRRGSNKLKNWGRENGLNIISIFYNDILENKDIKQIINSELYNQDPFDITGPVSSESEFFGRRDEAISFSKKIQNGNIHTILGIRKTGKTSILNRITLECNEKYSDLLVVIDCSRDDIWNLDSQRLLKMMYLNVKEAREQNRGYSSLSLYKDLSPITIDSLINEIDSCNKQVIFVFDEFDYLTPSSPTNQDTWKTHFNLFWRQFRVVYQEICRRKRNLSIVLCGVTSKWFRESSIGGIENAALAFIPEEYLRPLQYNAVMAMIKALGSRCGLNFDQGSLDLIYKGTAGIPSWTRKACSYINRQIPVEDRPYRVIEKQAEQIFEEFVKGEGLSYAKVAIEHLFTVFPEIRTVLNRIHNDSKTMLSPEELVLLDSYGIFTRSSYSGILMQQGISLCLKKIEIPNEEHSVVESKDSSEWADEIAEISKRQNTIEKSLRKITIELIRSDSRANPEKGLTKDRILKCIEEKRRKDLSIFSPETILDKTLWLELIIIMRKEWATFQQVFGDQAQFAKNVDYLNNRPYAHAKNLDALEVAATKQALKFVEEKILKYENA